MTLHLHTFPREQRLKSKRLIDALFDQGEGGFVYPIRYVVLEREVGRDSSKAQGAGASVKGESSERGGVSVQASSNTSENRIPEQIVGMPVVEGVLPAGGAALGEICVLVSVSKRNHKRANARNLIKRRLREAYRLNKNILRDDYTQTGKHLSLGLLYASKEVVDYQVIEHAVKKILHTLAARL